MTWATRFAAALALSGGLAACDAQGPAAHARPARFAYVPLLSSSGILGFAIHPDTRELTPVPGGPFEARVSSRLVVHPSGRFVYGLSYYTGGTLYGFAVDAVTGALGPIPGLPLHGNYKTAVAVSVDGRYLYVANTFPWHECGLPQAPAIRGYAVDPSTGALTEVATGVPPGTSQWVVAHPSGSLSFTFFTCESQHAVIETRRIDGGTGMLLPVAESPLPRALSSLVPRLDPSGRLLYARDTSRAGMPLLAYPVDARSGVVDAPAGVEALPEGPIYGDFDFDPGAPRLYLTERSRAGREPVAMLTTYEIFPSGVLRAWSDPLRLPGPACASVSADPSGRYLYVASSCTSFEPMHGQVWGDPTSLTVIRVEDSGKRLRMEREPVTVPEFGGGPFALIGP